ncbi:unnamed protein product, partial [Symbiodinium sp. CCMP2456]
SVKAGAVRNTRAKTRRVSGFNAFQKAHKHHFKQSRLGTAENRQETRNLGEIWRNMPAEARARYEEQARELQSARDDLKGKCLSKTASAEAEAADTGILSTAQVKRLNGFRLDKTLSQVSEHRVWQAGLGIADHVAALKASLVIPVPDAAAMRGIKRQYEEAFSYDSQIVPNPPTMPKFSRPCCTLQAGTCQCDPCFAVMQRFVKEFHEQLIAQRLGGSPSLVQLTPSNDASMWLIVCTVALRPQCHVVAHLHSLGGSLYLTMQNGSISMGTMHRVMRRMLQAASRGGVPLDEFTCTVAVRLYGASEMADSQEMQFLQPDEEEALSEHVLSAGNQPGLPGPRRAPAAPAGGCRLPFGLVASRTTRARKPTSESKVDKGRDAETEGASSAPSGETAVAQSLGQTVDKEEPELLSSVVEGTCLLSPGAQAELEMAMQLQRHWDASQDPEDDARTSKSRSCASLDPDAAPAGSRARPRPEPSTAEPVSGPGIFQARLGILSVGRVQRPNVSCYFCQSKLAKGSLRFEYAYKLNKPPQSIHASCLAQIPDDQLSVSIGTLGYAIGSQPLSSVDRYSCERALDELSSRL